MSFNPIGMNLLLIGHLITVSLCSGCSKSGAQVASPARAPGDTLVVLSTDKACYHPGDVVTFTADKALPVTAKIRYRSLDSTLLEVQASGQTWQWTAPATDFTGYMVDVCSVVDGVEKIHGSIAVDVSSDWYRFPRYGFLSSFGQFTDAHMDSVIGSINRLHLNGIQFQDWEYKHHLPLAGTVASPSPVWKDIANRDNYAATVRYYIAAAHAHGIKTMSYNLCYGALDDAAADGVADRWYMYTDQLHMNKEVVPLPMPPFKSNLNLVDPSNPDWQNYIAARTNDAFAVYSFDGYQVDQMGNLNKPLYNYAGNPISLDQTFLSFLQRMKALAPSRRLVMNAVSQFGQQVSIARAPVDFLYSEVWPPDEGFKDLATIIQQNDQWANHTKKTVLAAYMDYNIAGSPGYFNTPGVLLADAVIFSFGGSHLELGDHMLCKEYFPNNNLQMKPDLQRAIVHYYDFLTAYEDLLQVGGRLNQPDLISADGKVVLSNWPPQPGAVSMVGKDMGGREVIQLINLASANIFDWRDANANQRTPNTLLNAVLIFTASRPVKKLWYATPDADGGVAKQLSFSSSGNSISFTLPSLQYWDMVVAEYQ